MTTNKKTRLVIAAIIAALFVFSCENPMVIAILPDKKKKEQPGILKESIEFTDDSAEIAKTYGDPLFTNAVAATYLGTGAVAYSSSDEAVATVNAQNGEVTIAGAGETVITAVKAADERYAQAEASYTLTVAKAALAVTAENKNIDYNADAPAYTYTISGFVYGDDEAVISGTPALVCAYAKGGNTGSYPVTFADENLSAANYNFVYANGALSVGLIDQAALTITSPGSKTYGDANFTLATSGGSGIGTVTYSIVSGGDVIGLSGAAVTIKKAGSATVKAAKAGDGNYNSTESAALTITIGKRNLSNATVTAGGTPAYTGSAHTPSPTVTDGGASITASDYTVSYADNKNAGTAKVTITAASNGNYTGTQSGTFTIGKAALTVSAEDKTIAYGAVAPEYTYAVTGFVTGENESVISGNAELDCEYAQNDPKGTYPITFTAENFTATNYRFEYEDGELAVGIQAQEALALSIEDDSLSIEDGNITVTYGDANFTLTAEGGSGEGGVRYRVLSGTDVIGINSSTGEVFIKKAGTATVGARKSSDDEYSRVVAEAVTVTVGKRDLSNAVVSVSGTFTYDGDEQTPTPTVADGSLISGSDWEVLSYSDNTGAGTATVTITATDGGSYTGTQSGEFEIGKATLTVTADDKTISYNDEIPDYTYTINTDGFKGADTEAAITGIQELELVCAYAKGDSAGTYGITFAEENLSAANYRFEYEDGALSVGKIDQAALSITAPGAKTYGDAPFDLAATGGSGDGAVSYEVASGDAVSISGATVTIVKAGSATVTAKKAGDANYNAVTSSAITITVGKRNLSNASVSVSGSYTYTGSAQTPVPSVTDGGAVIAASDYTFSHSNNTNAGTATVTKTGNFTIGKADPVVTWPSGFTAPTGWAVSTMSLPRNGTSDVAGTFTWTSPTTAVGAAGTRSHSMTFTPNDTGNYNALTQNISITVKAVVSVINAGDMASISAGTFLMGSPDGTGGINGSVAERLRSSNETLHSVTLTSGFKMGKYQVTQEQYAAVMLGSNPSYSTTAKGRPPAGIEVEAKRPVETVSWYDAIVFCNRLSIMEGLTPAYRIPSYGNSNDPEYWIASNSGVIPTSINVTWNAVEMVPGSTGYRLPTEAQWEYACRAGTATAFYNGNNYDAGTNYDAALVGAVAWFSSNSGGISVGTHEVGKKAANALGLYDMHGNVYEWCWDCYAVYSGTAETDPTGPTSPGANRVLRGGSWGSLASVARSAYRVSYAPVNRDGGFGFRILCP